MQSKCHTEFVEHDLNFEEIDSLFNIVPPFSCKRSGLCDNQENNYLESIHEPITTHNNEIMRIADSSCKANYLNPRSIGWSFFELFPLS